MFHECRFFVIITLFVCKQSAVCYRTIRLQTRAWFLVVSTFIEGPTAGYYWENKKFKLIQGMRASPLERT